MKAVCEAKALAAPPVAVQRSVRPRCTGRICPTVPHRQQLRNAMLVRSTVADVETAELDAATPEQVDAAVAAPAEATIAVNAETDQKSSSGGRQGRQGNGRRAPRVSLESISVDQEMEGVVKNVADFGCFVDIGCGKDGLVHISQLSSDFVKDPREVVTAGQRVRVRVVSVDPVTNKIALTMRSKEDVQAAQEAREQPREAREPAGEGAAARSGRERLGKIATRGGGGGQRKQGGAREKPKTTHSVGESLKAVVVTTTAYGAFVRLPDGTEALLHVSEMAAPADTVSPQARDLVKPEDEIEVRVVEIMSSGKVSVSQKSEEEAAQEKQMASGGMSSGVSTAGMSLLQAALARAGVSAETFATEDEKKQIEAKKAEKAAKKKPAKAGPAPAAAEQPSVIEDDAEPAGEAEPEPEAEEPAEAVAAVADAAADVLPEPVASIAKAASDTVTEDAPAAAAEEEAIAESAPVEESVPSADEEPAAPEPAAEAAEEPAASSVAEVEDVAATVEMPDEEMPKAASEAAAAEESAPAEEAQTEEEHPAPPGSAAEASQEPAEAAEDVTATVEMPLDEEPTPAQNAVAEEEPTPVAEAPAKEAPPPAPEAAAEPEPVAAAAAAEPAPAEEPSPDKDSEEPTSAIENAAEAAVDAAQAAAGVVGSVFSKAVNVVASGASDAAAQLADFQPAAAPEFPPPGTASAPTPEPAAEPEPEAAPESATEPAVAAAADSSSSNGAAAPASNGAAKGAEISAKVVKELRDKSGAGMMQCKKALAEAGGDLDKAVELLRVKGLATADKKAGRVATEGIVTSYIHAGARLGVLIEVNCETDFVAKGDRFKELVSDLAMQVAASPEASYVSAEDVSQEFVDKETAIEMEKEDILSKPEAIRPKIVQGRVAKTVNQRALLEQAYIKDSGKTVGEVVKEAIAGIGENIKIRRFERYVLGEGIEKKEADLSADIEEQKKSFEEAAAKKAAAAAETQEVPAAEADAATEAKPTVQVSAKVVKELREKSGAGMMDCKKALAECEGDLDAAADYLRKKGLASAGKKAGRVASEGAVGAYIHAGSRLGVLVEVNCETDFVARGERFQELVQDLAMQIAASSEVQVVALEDVSADLLAKEREIELQKEDLAKKPEAIREKMVEGRLSKIAKTLALLEQPFIKDSSKTVAEHIKEAVAGIGENIKIRRFTRYNLGEGLEKKESDFAAEVAAQTGQAA